MKNPNWLSCLAIPLFLVGMVPKTTAQTALPIEEAIVKVGDPKLQLCLRSQARKQGWRRIDEVVALSCNNQGIKAAIGLEVFRHLRQLTFYNNQLTHFDCHLFANLEQLNLARNHLQELYCRGNSRLEELYAFGNSLSLLKLDELEQLNIVKANNNALTKLEYKNLPKLEKLYLFENKMEHLDIYRLPKMHYLDVRENPMPDALYDEMDQLKGVTVLHDGNAEDWQ